MRLISFKKKRIDSNAKTNALMKPTIKNGSASIVKYCQFFSNERKLAPAMIGTAMMKVKSDADRWLMPNRTPPEIVAPEREKPGHNDNTCTVPTSNACLCVI